MARIGQQARQLFSSTTAKPDQPNPNPLKGLFVRTTEPQAPLPPTPPPLAAQAQPTQESPAPLTPQATLPPPVSPTQSQLSAQSATTATAPATATPRPRLEAIPFSVKRNIYSSTQAAPTPQPVAVLGVKKFPAAGPTFNLSYPAQPAPTLLPLRESAKLTTTPPAHSTPTTAAPKSATPPATATKPIRSEVTAPAPPPKITSAAPVAQPGETVSSSQKSRNYEYDDRRLTFYGMIWEKRLAITMFIIICVGEFFLLTMMGGVFQPG